jgi:hypothetical protein
MKRVISLIISGFFAGTALYGQCIPDPENCEDTSELVQICPKILPDAPVNVYYDAVFTVIAPGEVIFGPITFNIDYIVVDSIVNLPEGISYAANTEKFYADSAYCFQLYGIPVKTGVDTLSIYITPYFVDNPNPAPQVVDDTSVVMTVTEASGIDPGLFTAFHLLPNKPNPFSSRTTVGFFTPFDDHIELQVYNILGTLVHEEKGGFPPGEYNFEFDGLALAPGTYFYRVSNPNQFYTGKLIKTKR